MMKQRLAHLGLAMAAIGFTAASPLLGLSTAVAAESVSQAVGAPLQAAQTLMKQGKHKEALSKLNEAGSAAKNGSEQHLVDKVRYGVLVSSGDYDGAARAAEKLLASGKLGGTERANFEQGLLSLYLRAKEYGKANAVISQALKENPNNSSMRGYLLQNYFAQGNTKALASELASMEKAGRTPTEDQYGMLANLYNKNGDKEGYVNVIEKLAQHYPNVNSWTTLLQRVTGKPGFNSSRLGVDVYRLRAHNNLLKKPSEYMEYAQLALQAKAPGEANKVIDKAYKAGIFGTGAEAARHQRLKDLATKTLAEDTRNLAANEAALVKAKDQDGLFNLGYGLVQAGDSKKGIALMEKAVESGALKYPEEAKMRLGQAYAVAGNKSKAISTLKTVKGTDGSAELARYWILAINKPLA